MDGYGPATYGESFADVYDDWYASLGDEEGAIARLAELARDATASPADPGGERGAGAPILELGVGTGRLAIPLAELGFDVWGVDASPAMLDRLRRKPGGERVRTVLGDMADIGAMQPVEAGPTAELSAAELGAAEPDDAGLSDARPIMDPGDRRFMVVFAAFNTFFNLTSEADQVRCLRGAAGRLAPGGRLVIEAFVPSVSARSSAGVVEVARIDTDRVVLTVSRSRPDDQVVEGQHLELSATGNRMRPWRIRVLSPDQLDHLAATAGLILLQRSAGWRDEPFDATSPTHVSVYGLLADPERPSVRRP